VLFVDENTGCSDLAIDPNNPRILRGNVAARDPHLGKNEGGPGRALRLEDGAKSWTRLKEKGLPKLPVGKVGGRVAPLQLEPRLRSSRRPDGVPSKEGEEVESGESQALTTAAELEARELRPEPRGPHSLLLPLRHRPRRRERGLLPHRGFQLHPDGGETIKDPTGPEVAGGDNHDMGSIPPTPPDGW
jgi:hypothetical protein